MKPRYSLRGLYAITDHSLGDTDELVRKVELSLLGGARVIQYRDKASTEETRLRQAQALNALCRRHRVPLIINDDVELAVECRAAGVHLGKDDGSLEKARSRLGGDSIIGVSCYNEYERAERAIAAGADYIAFGRFFSSRTKPGAVQADLSLLQRARTEIPVPVVAIGGITSDNGALLVEAGADMLAVIQGVYGQPDIRQASRRFADLFNPEELTE